MSNDRNAQGAWIPVPAADELPTEVTARSVTSPGGSGSCPMSLGCSRSPQPSGQLVEVLR
jgi:hypothetical protein